MAISLKNPSGILVARQFESFEEFSSLAVGWDADFRQLDAEQFKSDMFQAQIESILVTGAHFGCHSHQRGSTPSGMRAFAIPDADCSEMTWQGHVVEADVLLSFPLNSEIDVHSRPGFGIATFSIPETLLSEFFVRNGGCALENYLGTSEKVIRAPELLLKKIRCLYRQLQNSDGSYRSLDYWRVRNLEIQEQILGCLFNILVSTEPVTPPTSQRNRHKLNHLLELIHFSAEGNLRISELCAAAQVPERTAQYIFKRELGMTPKAYLTGQRMYVAHRDLWQADPSIANVSDIANRLGFWHMGQFAADYRRVFGELPSTTLNRAA